MRERQSVRIILLNSARQVLLFEINDGASPNPVIPTLGRFWVAPGGGIEPGETAEDAAHRELREETGMTGLMISEQIATFQADATYANGDRLRIINHVFIADAGDRETTNIGMNEEELTVVAGFRWWSIDELRAERPHVRPPGFVDLVERVVRGIVSSAVGART